MLEKEKDGMQSMTHNEACKDLGLTSGINEDPKV